MENILLQFSGILVPILLLQVLHSQAFVSIPSSVMQKLLYGGLFALSIFMCMNFPTSLIGNYYDLRAVPLFLGILYGGYDVGAVLACLLVLYRFSEGGGIHSFEAFIIMGLSMSVVFWEYRRFHHRRFKHRILVAMVLALFFSLITSVISTIFISKGSPIPLLFYATFTTANIIAMALATFLIEKHRENELLKARLNDSDKMRVVSHLAASIAHEVRNPLTVVSGFVKLLTNEPLDTEKRQFYGHLAMNELNRAGSIISDYLTFARPEVDTGQSVIADLEKKIVMAINVMRPYATVHNIEIRAKLSPDLHIQVNREKFIQVLVNVLKNSIEAMPDGGVIHVISAKERSNALIRIIDHGVGMSEEQLKHLGFPFYSSKEKGTGLGLMISYRIIEALGGSIQVSSRIGEGTRFTIRVPLVKRDDLAQLTDSSAISIADTQS